MEPLSITVLAAAPVGAIRYRSVRALAAACLLVVAVALISGCPLAVGDPFTESRITNDTAAAVDVVLTFDYGTEQPESAEVQRHLGEYTGGEGVTLVSIEPGVLVNSPNDGMAGTYRIEPSGFMIVHSGLGTEPYFAFDEMMVSMSGVTHGYHAGIEDRFQRGEGYQYEFRISDLVPGDSGDSAGWPEPEEATRVSWEEAKRIIREWNVESVYQTHSLHVGIELANGERYETTEPEIDAVIRWVEECGKEDSISIATE